MDMQLVNWRMARLGARVWLVGWWVGVGNFWSWVLAGGAAPASFGSFLVPAAELRQLSAQRHKTPLPVFQLSPTRPNTWLQVGRSSQAIGGLQPRKQHERLFIAFFLPQPC